jgi:hypothetical protein
LLQPALTGRRIESDSDISAVKRDDYWDGSTAKQWQPENSVVAEVNVQKANVVGADYFRKRRALRG